VLNLRGLLLQPAYCEDLEGTSHLETLVFNSNDNGGDVYGMTVASENWRLEPGVHNDTSVVTC
jgi:hypothetical protein